MKLKFHSIVHRDIQEVCGSSRILTALVLKFARAWWGAVALLTSYLMPNTWVGEKGLHSLIFLARLHGDIHNCLVQACSRIYRLISNLFVVFSWRILFRMHWKCNPGSPTEKSITLYKMMVHVILSYPPWCSCMTLQIHHITCEILPNLQSSKLYICIYTGLGKNWSLVVNLPQSKRQQGSCTAASLQSVPSGWCGQRRWPPWCTPAVSVVIGCSALEQHLSEEWEMVTCTIVM